MFVANEVLANFDQGVGNVAACAVAPHRVALQGAGVGLVVADNNIAWLSERVDQGIGDPAIRVGQNGGMPGPRLSRPAGREAVNGDQNGQPVSRDETIEDLLDGVMIGAVKLLNPRLTLDRVDGPVAGNDGAVGEPHDEGWIVEAPVGVDQETGKAAENGDRLQALGKPAGDAGGADIVCNMTLEHVVGQAEIVVALGDEIAGVVAEDNDRAVGISAYDLKTRAFAVGMGRRWAAVRIFLHTFNYTPAFCESRRDLETLDAAAVIPHTKPAGAPWRAVSRKFLTTPQPGSKSPSQDQFFR